MASVDLSLDEIIALSKKTKKNEGEHLKLHNARFFTWFYHALYDDKMRLLVF